MKFALLLDSGALIPLGSKLRTKEDARHALRSWNESRRQMIARRELISPRRALGLVTFKARNTGKPRTRLPLGRRRLAPNNAKG